MTYPSKMSLAAASLVLIVAAAAQSGPAAEYVRVCNVNGPGLTVPGTDICLNPSTGATNLNTVGGVWQSFMPNSPARWVPNAAADCLGGRLVTLGTIAGSGLTTNSHGRYESSPVAAPALATGEFISNLMLSGGLVVSDLVNASGVVRFTGTDGTDIPQGTEFSRADGTLYATSADGVVGTTVSGQIDIPATAEVAGATGLMTNSAVLTLPTPITGVTSAINWISGFDVASTNLASANFCLSFLDASGNYSVLGCEDAVALAGQPATISFVPRTPVPPAGATGPISIVGNEQNWHATGAISGSLSVSACVRNINDTSSGGCSVVDNGNGATVTCGSTTVALHNGTNGADGASCSVAENPAASGVTLTCGATTATITNGTNGTNGTDGTSGHACTVTDHGDGTATMTCPDGSSATLLTKASAAAKSSGCTSGPEAGMFALLGLGMLALRSRSRRVASLR